MQDELQERGKYLWNLIWRIYYDSSCAGESREAGRKGHWLYQSGPLFSMVDPIDKRLCVQT